MRVIYTEAARSNLVATATYLEVHNPAAVATVVDDILVTIDRLAEFPYSGRRQDEADVRKLVSPRYRYRIFYLIEEEAAVVTILSVLHPARQS